MKITLTQDIPSKKNETMFWKGRVVNRKNKALESLVWEVKSQMVSDYPFPPKVPLEAKIRLTGDDRKDLSNQINTIFDVLQDAKLIHNDRQIKYIHAEKHINKVPYCEIEINETNFSAS